MNCTHSNWDQTKCYFCHKTKRWTYLVLADGCKVPICGECYKIDVQNKKIAQERGIYDPSKLSVSRDTQPQDGQIGNNRRNDTMKVQKGAVGGNNLKAGVVAEKEITKLKIVSEGNMVTYEPQKEGDKETSKLVVGISYENQKSGDPDNWAMNNKSRNALIDIFGDDTKDWVGKEIEINLAGEGEYRHIVVDTVRTKK